MGQQNGSQGRGYSAFISHASADHETAESIASSLEAKGLSCWIAPRDVRPGAEYAEEILRGIERSKCFVLLLSEAANLSVHVRREVERAAAKGKPIYPVRIENVPPSPKLEYFVSMHHWIDAWEGMLGEHSERLAAALRSDEEWISNLVVKRRRRRIAGLGAGLAVAVISIVLGNVFSGDIRDLFKDEKTLATEELVKRNPVDVEELTKALSTSSIKDLDLFDAAGISSQQLNVAFAAKAKSFFEQSRNRPDAIKWLEGALNNGLDPNLPIPHDHYDQESMLASAMKAGNTDAMLALLDAGATPHVYQNLMLSPYDLPRFLFPYYYLVRSDDFSREDKHRIAEAYAKSGAVFKPLHPENAGTNNYQISATRKVLEQSHSVLGFAPEPTPSACDGRSATPICKAASARTGKDWCGFMEELPVRIVWNDEKSYDYNLLRVDLHNLLVVNGGKAYVLGTETIGRRGEYLLVEIAPDGLNWKIYKHTQPMAGKGHCKKLVEDGPESPAPKYCWRRWSATYLPSKKIVKIDDYYEYDAFFDCSKGRP